MKNPLKDHYIVKLSKLLYYLSRLIVGEDGELFEDYVCALEEKISKSDQKFIDIRLVCKTSKPTWIRLMKSEVKSIVFASGTINKKQFTKEETGLDLTHAYYPSKSLFPKENITTFIVPTYGSQILQLRGRYITDRMRREGRAHEPQYNKDEII